MLSAGALVVFICSLAQQPRALSWEEVGPTPQGVTPQGLAAPDGRLLLSAYRGAEESSAIFHVDLGKETVRFKKLFAMPAEARHTSGLAEIPGRHDRLFALDYRSGFIYLLDLPASSRSGQAVVLTRCITGLQGPSACCVVRLANGQWLLMVTEFKMLRPGHNVMFEFHPGSPDPRRAGAIEPFVRRYDLAPIFNNRGHAQGAKFHNGLVYEAGNRLGGPSYLIRYRLEDALIAGRIPTGQDRGAERVEQFHGPKGLIEDIALHDGYLWVTDEGTRRLYRTSVPLGATDRSTQRTDYHNTHGD
jgi:hypothetical protein